MEGHAFWVRPSGTSIAKTILNKPREAGQLLLKGVLMPKQKAGTVAIIAILSAISSLMLTLSGHPVAGLVAAFVAIITGFIGVVVSASPKIGGGLVSTLAIIAGVVDTAIAIIAILGVVLF